ncbi:MAG TPA: tRNA (adenosine(37)-N6)-threonylcarbamoyltransferase complex dimerization subunit type 1 TsaB [Planctomycetes bacterium]|nr:tRNA (adenosine(37)-N6)-threonylcarbamoyltransferase complex dimerization subunit type 1 TsaB [Planctomycetota bacterium]
MILALELSGPCSSIALGTEKEIFEKDFSGERGKALLAEIDALIQHTKVKRSAIRGVLVGRGPGSYTGLRIGCTAARILSLALNIPVGGIGSFPAAVFDAPEDIELHLVQNAYRGEICHAAYRKTKAGIAEITKPHLLASQDLKGILPAKSLVIGDPQLTPRGTRHLSNTIIPQAKNLIRVAMGLGVKLSGEGLQGLEEPSPLYLRAAAFKASQKNDDASTK